MHVFKSAWQRDLIIVTIVTIGLTAFFLSVNAFEVLEGWFEAYESWGLDEYFLGFVALGFSFIWYSYRRLIETRTILEIQSRTRANLRKTSEEFSFLMSATPGVFYSCKAYDDFGAIYVSESIKQLLGYTSEEYIGDPSFWAKRIHPDDKQRAFDTLERLLKEGRVVYEYRFRHADGSYRWMQDQLTVSKNKDGKVERIVGFWIDITDVKNREQELEQRVSESTKDLSIANNDLNEEIKKRKESELAFKKLAETDELTQLPNRMIFSKRMEEIVEQMNGTDQRVCIILLDMDHFKHINDTLGHRLGDILLCHAASRIVNCTRETDTVVRLGGDEFAIIITDFHHEDEVREIAQRILASISKSYDLEGQMAYSSPSMGIMIATGSEFSPEEIFQNADIALYETKRKGGKGFTFYNEQLSVGVNSRREIELALRKAMKNSGLELFYQPQIDINTGRIYGAEALLRWNHPEWGMVSPGRFIPVAEETRLIIPIGDWVIRTACKQAMEWQKQGLPPITMAVNVSPLQLMHHDMVGVITRALDETGLDPKWLEVEITESLAGERKSIEKLSSLREIGVHLAIDDFGTGYSSLERLQTYPVGRLKIDQSFVRGLGREGYNGAAIEAIVQLGRSLDMNVIAEGVETLEEMQALKDMNCDEAQGFLFSPALPPEVFADFHKVHTPKVLMPKIIDGTVEASVNG